MKMRRNITCMIENDLFSIYADKTNRSKNKMGALIECSVTTLTMAGIMHFLLFEQHCTHTNIKNMQNVPSKIWTVLGSIKEMFSFKKLLKSSCCLVFRSPAAGNCKPVPFTWRFSGTINGARIVTWVQWPLISFVFTFLRGVGSQDSVC